MQAGRGRSFAGRLIYGEDLLQSLEEICRKENIAAGTLSVIGAVKKAKVGYYDQSARKYNEPISIERCFEIASCIGNISLKDGKIFVHAHITFADLEGKCFGGHLMPGTVLFAAEYYIEELTGLSLERKHNDETGLSLWENT